MSYNNSTCTTSFSIKCNRDDMAHQKTDKQHNTSGTDPEIENGGFSGT